MEDQGQQSSSNETGKELPNRSINRTRIPTSRYPFDHSGPVISSLGSWGKMLTKSQDKVAMIKPEQRTISTRGRASRYALIELPRKPSAANDKASLTTGSTGPACHHFIIPLLPAGRSTGALGSRSYLKFIGMVTPI